MRRVKRLSWDANQRKVAPCTEIETLKSSPHSDQGAQSPKCWRSWLEREHDVFRLNASHGTHDEHRKRYADIRALEGVIGRPIGVLFDLQGPKLRLGDFEGGRAELTPGQKFRLDRNPQLGDSTRVCLPHVEIFAAVSVGTRLLLDDGQVHLRGRSARRRFDRHYR